MTYACSLHPVGHINCQKTAVTKDRHAIRIDPARLSLPRVQSETDSETVGHIICQKALELCASCVLMGSHDQVGVAWACNLLEGALRKATRKLLRSYEAWRIVFTDGKP